MTSKPSTNRASKTSRPRSPRSVSSTARRPALEYRGIPVEVLAKESSFEEVVVAAHQGRPADAEATRRLRPRPAAAARDPLPPEGSDPVHAGRRAPDGRAARVGRGARHVLPVPHRDRPGQELGRDDAGSSPRCRRVVAAFARTRRGEEILDPRNDLDHAGNFYYMLFGKEPTPAVRKVLDACLILHAEHTMNASTFTARVTGSTLANPYQVIASAIGSLSGPLHGGANEEALRQFEEIGAPANVKAWLDAKLASQPEVQGHGHRPPRLQGEGRPRDGAAGDRRAHVRRVHAGRRITRRRSNWNASARASTGRRESTRTSISTRASCTRRSASRRTCSRRSSPSPASPGWLAHWHEQLVGNRIFRPEQIFVGKTDVKYVPLEQRP